MTLTDTGPLVALVDKGQSQNLQCRALFATLPLPLLTTWPVFTEAMYLLSRIGGWTFQHNLWKYVEAETLIFHAASTEETLRMRELMEQYHDTPMDLADASLVATAETLNLHRIFSLDSDFYIYQRHGRKAFEVVPGTG